MPFGKVLKQNQAHGYSTITEPGVGTIERETRMCCHCGKHWLYDPIRSGLGLKKDRGFCMKCSALTCGKRDCDPCYPYEERIDDMEKPSFMPGFTNLYSERISKIRNVVPNGWQVKNGILMKA